ncbi:MAG: TlyA family RNA methyltransferase [Armatimonadetes bacterium]|nr:TlyA family RNA methyltransferase [Armatimonadota bacterium]MDW8153273.1 TlyA family RNA methyltransferase [Armatimonadota bacterium]
MSAARKKERLDTLLVRRGLAPSRERAQAYVLAGRVFVDGRRVDKPGTPVPEEAVLEVRGPDHPYVSRGGVKLERALQDFHLDVRGAVALDLGASAGGFTDCLLQHGARRVYAVDVGWGQLHPKLRQDPRVVVLERTHAKDLSPQLIPEPLDFACADVSFISLTRALPPVVPLLREGAPVVALVKPQFEAGRGMVREGVVRDPQVHRAVIRKVVEELSRHGLGARAVIPSPIRGDAGNVEFLVLLRKGEHASLSEEEIEASVEEAQRLP